MGAESVGAPGARVCGVGAAWILLESHLPSKAAGVGVSFSWNRGMSLDLIGSFPPVCDN